MRLPRSKRLVDKAEAAMLSAIEIYNKPDFKYREETFAILMLNAWELLLKARLLAASNNDPRVLLVRETRVTKSGAAGKRLHARKNRSGNYYTKSLGQVVMALDADPATRLPNAVKANLEALTEVRDNAVHYFNIGQDLTRQVLEIGTASVRNFVESASAAFHRDLSHTAIYLLPIGFLTAPASVLTLPTTADETRLVNYLAQEMKSVKDEEGVYQIALEVEVSLKRSTGAHTTFSVGSAPGALQIKLSEEDIRQQFPWDYRELVLQMAKRYSNFKQNGEFHLLRKPIQAEQRLVRTRLLDPAKPNGTRKDYYSPNILQVFDQHYARAIA